MEHLYRAIGEATKETFLAICGSSVNSKPPVDGASAEPYQAELSVIIGVVGEIDGTLAFRCSRTLAAEVAGAMLGMEIDSESDDIKDAMGEFFNMIVGSLKRFLAREHDPFSMSVPTTIVGSDYSIFVNTAEQAHFVRIPLTWNDHEAVVEVYMNR